MKTRILIEQLQKADPTGEAECVVGCQDIHFVAAVPMFYDGTPTLLERDETKSGYNIIGLRVPDRGIKIKIHTLSRRDVFLDHPDTPVYYASVTACERMEAAIEKDRAECINIISQIDSECPGG